MNSGFSMALIIILSINITEIIFQAMQVQPASQPGQARVEILRTTTFPEVRSYVQVRTYYIGTYVRQFPSPDRHSIVAPGSVQMITWRFCLMLPCSYMYIPTNRPERFCLQCVSECVRTYIPRILYELVSQLGIFFFMSPVKKHVVYVRIVVRISDLSSLSLIHI